MKRINLLLICLFLVIYELNAQTIMEIPYTGTDVTVTISGSIYYPNIGPQYDDHIYGVVVLYIRDGGDGSILTGNVYEGTNYYKPDPDVLHFTSNSNVNSLFVYALDWPYPGMGTITGEYIVNVNGVDYTLTPSNVIYINLCWNNIYDIMEIPYSGTDVTVTISGSIYYPNGGPQYDDHIYGVTVLYNRNDGDGSVYTGNIYEGTNYYKPDPDVLHFTSNSNEHNLIVYALDWPYPGMGTLTGEYIVNVNGTDYTLTPSNVVYHDPCPREVHELTNITNNSDFLKQNFPNPLFINTTIEYSVLTTDFVKIDIFNEYGILIKNLVNEKKSRGEYSVIWNCDDNNGKKVPDGVYFYQMRVGDYYQTKKLILMK